MILRNGIACVLRAKGRTALFAALIFFMCLSLTLGAGMWAYCDTELAALNDTYTSIALVEYMGGDYPDEHAADPFARKALTELAAKDPASVPGVTLWETADSTLANLDGYLRVDDTPFSSHAVIEFVHVGKVLVNGLPCYTGISNRVYYARDTKAEQAVIIDTMDLDFEPELGHRYTLHGKFIQSNSSNHRFAVLDFYEGCEEAPWQDTSQEEVSPIFLEHAEFYRRANSFVTVTASADIASLEAFQQDIFRLSEGRFPKAGEESVCVISQDVASKLKLRLGDTIDLNLLSSQEDSRLHVRASDDVKRLTIVGISTAPDHYRGYVWVSDAEGGFDSAFYGYTLGRAVLKNEQAREATDEIRALAGKGVRVTLLDQGYAGASQPLKSMRSAASAVTVASILGCVAVLVLFSYLFVGRQKENVSVLVSLGTPKHKINLWLLSGALAVSSAASVLGALFGGLSLGFMTELALSAAESLYSSDTRYSEIAVGVVREAEQASSTPIWPAFAALFFTLFLSLVFCYVFLRLAQKQSVPKRGKLFVRVPKSGTSLVGKGALRFALLSARRGRWRSGVVCAAVLVLSLLLGLLASISSGWEAQLDALYDKSQITARAVTTNGRSCADLIIPPEHARVIYKSGLVEDMGFSIGFQYWFADEMPPFGYGAFSEESRTAWIQTQPQIIATNRLSAAGEFLYTGTPDIEWLEGWDESILSDPDICASLPETTPFYGISQSEQKENTAPIPCLVPRSVLARRNLTLGDSFTIHIRYLISSMECREEHEFLIVGTFNQAGTDANLYAPIRLWFDEDFIVGAEDVLADGERFIGPVTSPEDRDRLVYYTSRLSTCTFTLSDTHRLNELRSYLDENGFTRVDGLRSNRTTILLQDRTFVETSNGLGRYIGFSKLLFPALFLLVTGLGFVISWLVTNSRRMEFAILRGLGASRARVFFSFFLEQVLLSLVGVLICVLLLVCLTKTIVWLWAVVLFSVCYLGGTALSVLSVGKTKLMSLLGERE